MTVPVEITAHDRDAFPLDYLLQLRRNNRQMGRSCSTSVIIPARNCEPTIGNIVDCIKSDLMQPGARFVDELIVVDHDSTDSTAAEARAAGADVVHFADASPTGAAEDCGKGTVLRTGVWSASGDLMVFLDGDHLRFDSFKVSRLLGPLLQDQNVMFVKAFYEGYDGGRVTEGMARPVLSLLHPELASLQQPLSGEQAGRREVFDAVQFPYGWDVEYRLLAQVADQWGPAAIAQVDVEYKEHEHGDWRHVNRQAFELLHAALRNKLAEHGLSMPNEWGYEVLTPGPQVGTVLSRPARAAEWPPLSTSLGYSTRQAERSRHPINADSLPA